MAEESFCGCCGCQIQHGEWCLPCSKHLMHAKGYIPMWERTYFAQFGMDCPYQAVAPPQQRESEE